MLMHAQHEYVTASIGRARIAELEERMSFLNGLEKSLTELTRDPEERMEEYLNSTLFDDSRDGHAEVEEGNPRLLAESTALPNSVNTDEDLDSSNSGAALSKVQEDPLKNKSMWERHSTLEHKEKVDQMTVEDLRNIIREEVTEKVDHFNLLHQHNASSTIADSSTTENAESSRAERFRPMSALSNDPHFTARKDRLPQTLQEAVPVSIPWVFSGFSRNSAVRMKCFQICQSRGEWFTLFFVVLIANCVYIFLVPDFPILRATEWQIVDWICSVIYLFEVVCNIIAYGFTGRNAWFSVSHFHKMEFIILCLTIAEFLFILILKQEALTVRPFRLLRLLKLVVPLQIFGEVRVILDTLSFAAGSIGLILLMFAFFLVIFGTINMQLLVKLVEISPLIMNKYKYNINIIYLNPTLTQKKAQMYGYRYRCVTDDQLVDRAACASDFSTNWGKTCDFKNYEVSYPIAGGSIALHGSGYEGAGYDETWCKVFCYTQEECDEMATYGQKSGCSKKCADTFPADLLDRFGRKRYPRDRWGRVHSCQMPNTYCANTGNPKFGLQHLDNIGGYIPAMMQLAVPDDPSAILFQTLQSQPDLMPLMWILALLLMLICTWLSLGLIVATVTGTFSRVHRKYDLDAAATAGPANHIEVVEENGQFKLYSKNEGGETLLEVQNKDDFGTIRNELDEKEKNELDELERLRKNIKAILFESEFPLMMSAIIVLHCVCMGLQVERPDMEGYATIIIYVCYVFYAMELFMRFQVTGSVYAYWSNASTQLEVALILCSIIQFFPKCKFIGFFCALRIFRLYRYSYTLNSILECSIKSAGAIANLVFFLVLLTICFAVTGRYIFGSRMNSITRSNFGSMGAATLTTCQLLFGDEWSTVLYAGIHAYSSSQFIASFASIFIFLWFGFSKLVISNIFISLMIENFRVASTTRGHTSKPGHVQKLADSVKNVYQTIYAPSNLQANEDEESDEHVVTKKIAYSLEPDSLNSGGGSNLDVIEKVVGKNNKNVHLRSLIAESVLQESIVQMQAAAEARRGFRTERVLYCIGADNIVKILFRRLVEHPVFELIIYIAIILGSIVIFSTPPYDRIPDENALLDSQTRFLIELSLTIFFTVEMIARIICDGLLFTRTAYLKNSWNALDGLIVLVAWIDILGFQGGKSAKILRLLRCFKPLRLISRLKDLRQLLDAIFVTFVPVLYAIAFLMSITFVFALVGMGLFSGKMYRCNDEIYAAFPGGKKDCANTFVTDQGLLMARTWDTAPQNFDTLQQSFLSLTSVITINYVEIMYHLQDITEVDLSPKKDASIIFSIYIILFLIFGALFGMNLVVAFIVDGFTKNRKFTEQEIQYRRLLRIIAQFKPQSRALRFPKNQLSKVLRGIATSYTFHAVSASCMTANFFVVVSDHASPTMMWVSTVKYLDIFFLFQMCGEVVVNMLAFGIVAFFSNSWHASDFLVVVAMLFAYLTDADSKERMMFTMMLRLARMLRAVRVLRMIKGTKAIVDSVMASWTQLCNILALCALLLLMFGAVFMTFFGTTKSGLKLNGGQSRLSKTAAFDSIGVSMATLFTLLIGDDWFVLMSDSAVIPPYCTEVFSKSSDPTNSMFRYQGEDLDWGDCGSLSAYFWFPFFIMTCQAVLLNLVIGTIIDNFEFVTEEFYVTEDDYWSQGASIKQIQQLSEIFGHHALFGQYLPLWVVTDLLRNMPEPIGMRMIRDQNVVVWGSMERTVAKLIRAQLNMHAMDRVKEWEIAETKSSSSFWYNVKRNWLRYFSSREKAMLSYIDFHEFILTVVAWRKPDMIPDDIKQARWKRVEEIMRIYRILTIKDALIEAVATRHRRETNRGIANLVEFHRWSLSDEQRARYIKFKRKRKLALIKKAQISSVFSAFQDTPPVAVEEVYLEALDEGLPPNMIAHEESVRAMGIKFPRPHHGVECFLQQAATNKVVLKCVDIVNSALGLVTVDLRKVNWEGWIKDGEEDEEDFLFRPDCVKERIDMVDTDWIDLQFVIKASANPGGARQGKRGRGKKEVEVGAVGNRNFKIGSILDLHGYCTYTELNHKGFPKDPVSNLRLNIGDLNFQGLRERSSDKVGGVQGFRREGLRNLKALRKASMKQMAALQRQHNSERVMEVVKAHFASKVETHDAVFEVIGYVSIDGMPPVSSFASENDTNTLRASSASVNMK